MSSLDFELQRGLLRLGLVQPGEAVLATPLTGGVASDIWLVESSGRRFVVKRALAKLRVAADWRAPVERNAYEVAWLREAGGLVPGVAPRVLGHDPESGLFAMEWLPPDSHPLWKRELMAGRADRAFAAELGRRLASIHAGTAGRRDVAQRFATDRIFHSIRVEPYIEYLASVHPRFADRFHAIARATMQTKRALVHGDVSPKNILCGPTGPVLLDAECAWYGDPAFDLSFCLNHLLLKCAWNRAAAPAYLACFTALDETYLGGVTWEPVAELAARAGALLPVLFLARVDGKSPVEYLTDARDQHLVRRTALESIGRRIAHPDEVQVAWRAALAEGAA
jgi:aminoglycoside phosphotransferase (APT) family kinase protein